MPFSAMNNRTGRVAVDTGAYRVSLSHLPLFFVSRSHVQFRQTFYVACAGNSMSSWHHLEDLDFSCWKADQMPGLYGLVDVRFWHLADMACALHMSAFDPKRTSLGLGPFKAST